MASIFDKQKSVEVNVAPAAVAPAAVAPAAVAPAAVAPAAVAPATENVEVRKLSEKDSNGLSIKNAGVREKDAEKRKLMEELCGIIKSAVDDGKLDARALEIAQKLRPSFFGLSNVPAQFAPKDTTKAQDTLLTILGKSAMSEIKVGDTFTEMDAFTKARLGRKEAREMCNSVIREPKKFVATWITFDEKTAVYTVVAVGDKPADWTGYVPFKR